MVRRLRSGHGADLLDALVFAYPKTLAHLIRPYSAFPELAVGSACTSSFSRLARRSLALRPAHSRRHLYVNGCTEGFSHFVTSTTAPVASGWSVRRVVLAPAGKRRLLTAHANSGRSRRAWRIGQIDPLRSFKKSMSWTRSFTGIMIDHNRRAACAGRDRDRAGRRRRSPRIGGGAGARRRRRDAEPRGAAASDRRTGHGRHRRGHAKLLGNLFELQDLGAKDLKGIAGPARAWAALRREFGGEPLRGAARERPHRAGRAGGRIRFAAAALGQGEGRRRPGGAPFRRGRHRQIAADGGAARTPRRRTAHAAALFLLAAAHRQRVLPDHRPDGTRRRTDARRCAASEARQARRGARADLDLDRGRRAVRRDAVAAERRPLSRARSGPAAAPAENAGGARFADGSADARKVRC